jgi:hypothetical protein
VLKVNDFSLQFFWLANHILVFNKSSERDLQKMFQWEERQTPLRARKGGMRFGCQKRLKTAELTEHHQRE